MRRVGGLRTSSGRHLCSAARLIPTISCRCGSRPSVVVMSYGLITFSILIYWRAMLLLACGSGRRFHTRQGFKAR